MSHAFFERLSELVGSADLTIISNATGLSYNTLKNYVTGERLPTPEILLRLAQNTGFSLDWLLLGVGSPYLITKEASNTPRTLRIELPRLNLLVSVDPHTGTATGVLNLDETIPHHSGKPDRKHPARK